jgi:hypothetical protein
LAELDPGRTKMVEGEAEPDRSRHPATARELELRQNAVREDNGKNLD